MFFVDWWFVIAIVIGTVLIATSIWGIANASKRRSLPLRIVMRLACITVGGIASLAVVLFLAGSGCVSHTKPIYSPSRKMAARIEDSDGGATGGETYVELFWAHGFREQTVYYGEWKTVRLPDIEWINDNELLIHYSGESKYEFQCVPAATVKISCMPR